MEAGSGRWVTPLREDSRKVSITRRGASAACSGALLAALAGASGDPLLASVGVAAVAGVAAEFLGSSIGQKKGAAGGLAGGGGERDGKGKMKRKGRMTSIAGETVEFSVDIKTPPRLGEVELFAADPPFEVVGFDRTESGYTVDLKAKPEVYGDYALGRLWAVTGSRLGFFRSRIALGCSYGEAEPGKGEERGLGVEEATRDEGGKEGEARGEVGSGGGDALVVLRAYPRFYPLVLEALSLLGEGGAEAEASAAGRRRLGRGEEYAWSREYEPWDSPRFIDWKATARRARLSVKEFFEDAGWRGAAVLFDGRAPGRRSADEMARDLLSVVLGMAGTGSRVALLVEKGGGQHRRVEGSAEDVLRAALAEVFEVVVGADPEVFALFPPAVRSSLLRAIRKEVGREEGSGGFVGATGGGARAEIAGMARAGRLGDLVYIGCPLHGAPEAIMAISEAASCGARVTALMPTKPWLDAHDLEEAYELRVSWGNVRRAMEAATGTISHSNYRTQARVAPGIGDKATGTA